MGTTTDLTIVEHNKNYLARSFDQHRDLITSLSEQDQIDFRDYATSSDYTFSRYSRDGSK